MTNGEPDARESWILGHREQFRELADPVVLWHDSKQYLYLSGDMAWGSSDQGATWQHHPLNVREIGYVQAVNASDVSFQPPAFPCARASD